MTKLSFNTSLFAKNPRKYLHETIVQWGATIYQSPLSDFELESKQIASFGDYSTNVAFGYASLIKKAPLVIAQELQSELKKHIPESIIKIEVAANGFLNFFITPHGWNLIAQNLQNPRSRKKFFRKKIIIEFSSPNVAKPMHVGHLRATILGNALANIYRHSGIQPVTWNHIGDWGTQFGKLLVAYKEWGDPHIIEQNPIEELQKLYVEFHQKSHEDPSLEDRAREEFKKLEAGDSKNRHIWKYIVDRSLKEFNRMYELLRVNFDYIIGESFYESRLKPFIAWLAKNKYTQQSQGATIIPLSDPALPPALIQKSDGATLYLTRDLVSLRYRAEKIKPAHMLYIVGNEQSLHFKQLQEVNNLIHITTIPFEHVGFGLVLNALGKKFSTRAGDTVSAQEIMDEVFQHARTIQQQKDPHITPQTLDQKTQTLGLGVIQYSMLRGNRLSDITFDFDSLFSLSGNSFPYVQYTYARARSVLKKAKVSYPRFVKTDSLTPTDFKLIQTLSGFEHAIDKAIHARSLHHLTDYLFELSNALNALYEQSPILTDSNKNTRAARLYIFKHTTRVLKYGLALLGIEAQERM